MMSFSKHKSFDNHSSDYQNLRHSESSNDEYRDYAYYKEQEREIVRLYESYFIDPERYPHYRQEWEHFYDIRAEGVYKKGFDPKYFDFSREWRSYILNRLQVLKMQALNELDRKFHQNQMSRGHESGYSHMSMDYDRTNSSSLDYNEPTFSNIHRHIPSNRASNSTMNPPRKRSHSETYEGTSVASVYHKVDQSQGGVNYPEVIDLTNSSDERQNEDNFLNTPNESNLLKSPLGVLQKSLNSKHISTDVANNIKKAITNLENILKHSEEISQTSSSTLLSLLHKKKKMSNDQTKKTDQQQSEDLKRAVEKLKMKYRKIKEEPSVESQEVVVKSEPQEVSIKQEPQDVAIKQEPNEMFEHPNWMTQIRSSKKVLEQVEIELAQLEQSIQSKGHSRSKDGLSADFYSELYDYHKNRDKIISYGAKNITYDEIIGYLKNPSRLDMNQRILVEKIMDVIQKTDPNRFKLLKVFKSHKL